MNLNCIVHELCMNVILQRYTHVKLGGWAETELYRCCTRSPIVSIDTGHHQVPECKHMILFESTFEEHSVVTKNYHATDD